MQYCCPYVTFIHPVSCPIPSGLELAGSCGGDLSAHWADLPAPRGDTALFPTSCSLQVVPGPERPEEHGL